MTNTAKSSTLQPTPILLLSLFGFALCVMFGVGLIASFFSSTPPSAQEILSTTATIIFGALGFIGLWGMKRWGAYLYTIGAIPQLYKIAHNNQALGGFAISVFFLVVVWAYFHKMK
jgi:hypothetical protein